MVEDGGDEDIDGITVSIESSYWSTRDDHKGLEERPKSLVKIWKASMKICMRIRCGPSFMRGLQEIRKMNKAVVDFNNVATKQLPNSRRLSLW